MDRQSLVEHSLRQSIRAISIDSPNLVEELMEEMKGEYIRQYLLGIGGADKMTASDWGSIGGMLREQYRYLKGFADSLVGLSERQIAARIAMYINSAREAFERAKRKAASGATQERWVMDPEAEHCVDCVDYDSQGWQPIGTFPFPGDGSTECLTNCRCHKEYR